MAEKARTLVVEGRPTQAARLKRFREDRERGVDVGANAYIIKSRLDQRNLLEAVRRLG